MESYDYREAVLNDLRTMFEEGKQYNQWDEYTTPEELREALNEAAWVDDSVTGNGSGSYTFNSWQAEENLKGNLCLAMEALEEFGYGWTDEGYSWTDALKELGYSWTALRELGYSWTDAKTEEIANSPEALDVTIRCYLLSEAVAKLVDELESEGYFDEIEILGEEEE